MLQLKNDTPFQANMHLMPGPDGIDSLFTVVKGTFTLDAEPRPADEQVPVVLADEYYGEPGETSIRAASDLSLTKPGTDVLLVGHAYAARGRTVSEMDVTLSVGPVYKTVRVIGDRVWQKSGIGVSMSAPLPFEAMPLTWERAFGGSDTVDSELRAEACNPVGTGFRAPDGDVELDGLPLPNLEDPRHLIGSWKDNPPPACFAPLCAHWEPRRSYAGTYDEKWKRERAPYLPDDFDTRFFQVAPPDLVMSGHLKGSEPVEVFGASPSGALQFRLPAVALRIAYVLDSDTHLQPANLDTIIIEPDAARFALVWSAVLVCDKNARRVKQVGVTALGRA